MSWNTKTIGTPLALAVALSCTPPPPERRPVPPAPREIESAEPPPPMGKTIDLQLYVMSQCPYSAIVAQRLHDVLPTFGGAARLTVDYVGTVSPDGKLESMHGKKEVTGDLLQVCAMKHSADWLDFVACQFADYRNVATNADACGAAHGIAMNAIHACAQGAEGQELLAASFARAKAAGAAGTPTLLIDGEQYIGPRRKRALTQALCDAQGRDPSDICSRIPPPPSVHVVVLGDARCDECSTGSAVADVKRRFEAPAIEVLDLASLGGAALYAALDPKPLLPAAIFDKTLEADDEVDDAFLADLEAAGGDRRTLSTGGWNPRCLDPGGCALAECQGTLPCQVEAPKKLELFVMSRCPWGSKAITSMREVLANFDKHGVKIEFSVQFLGKGDKVKGLSSMHGPREVEEDLRQVCAIKHYAKKRQYLDYLVCRAKDPKSDDWKACTGTATGVDAQRLETCATSDEGKTLLEASFAYSNRLGRAASPSWLVNATHRFKGHDAETIKTSFCEHNPVAGCNVTLSGHP
jgi:2-hydroxychromene-2-carboxylate isomerase